MRLSPFSRVNAVVSPWGPWTKYQRSCFGCSPSLPLFTKLHQRELFHILPCLLTFRVKLKNSSPKICRPSDSRQSTNSSPTDGRQNRDYFRKYELSRSSQIGENFVNDQQLSDSLMTIDRCCCTTLQTPSTLHKHNHNLSILP